MLVVVPLLVAVVVVVVAVCQARRRKEVGAELCSSPPVQGLSGRLCSKGALAMEETGRVRGTSPTGAEIETGD